MLRWLACACLLVSQPLWAMLPVIDVDAISQLADQYQQLQQINQINQQIQQYTHNLVADAEGHYGMGDLMNSLSELKEQQYSPDTWEQAVQGLSGNQNEDYQTLWTNYTQSHPYPSQEEFASGSDDSQAELFQQQTASNQASAVTATYAFNQVNQELQKIHDLSDHIDTTVNTKAALDLNSRIAVELAYIQMQSLKMETIMNQQLADQSALNLHDQAQESHYRTLPPDTAESL